MPGPCRSPSPPLANYHRQMLIETLDTARDLGRLKEILGVMVRHGFGDTVRRLGLADRLERAGQVLNWPHAAELARLEPRAGAAAGAGGTGAHVREVWPDPRGPGRPVWPGWIAEFEKLHSHVPALPIDALRPQLREDLGDEPEAVFAWFDTTPLAAASIAQVHRARLHDGTEVIVKIRRPVLPTRSRPTCACCCAWRHWQRPSCPRSALPSPATGARICPFAQA